jgi:hypothetical protein
MRALLGLSVVGLLLSSAREASAMAAPPPPGTIVVPTPMSPTVLELLDATLSFKCAGHAPLSCEYSARYRLRNPTSAEVEQPVAVGTENPDDEVRLDAELVTRLADPEAKQKLGHQHRGIDVSAIRIRVPAGATRALVVRGSVTVSNDRGADFMVFPANSARHVVLANHQPDEEYQLSYSLGGLRGWIGKPRVVLELAAPDSYVLTGPLSRDGAVYRGTADDDKDVDIELYRPAPWVFPGGVLAGIGGSTGDARGLRLRVGGELAIGARWLFASAVYETNARGTHYIVPALHAATPMITIIPSLGAGLGMPVRIAPSTRVGVRLQLDLHLAFLGFLTTIDWYPKTATEPSLVQPTFLFQVAI